MNKEANVRLIPVSRRVFPALADECEPTDKTILEKVSQYNILGEPISKYASVVREFIPVLGGNSEFFNNNKLVKAFATTNNPYHESESFLFRFEDVARYITEGYADYLFSESVRINTFDVHTRIMPAKVLDDKDVEDVRKITLDFLSDIVEYKYCLIIKDHFIHTSAIILEDDSLKLLGHPADTRIKIFDSEEDADKAVQDIMSKVDPVQFLYTKGLSYKIKAEDIISRGVYINTKHGETIKTSDYIRVAQIPIFKKDGEK